MAPPRPTKPQRLLVEGPDDWHVVCSLLARHRVPEQFEVVPAGGDRTALALFEQFEADTYASGVTALGLVLDADLDVQRRWQGVTDRLLHRGYHNLPAAPDPAGTIIAGRSELSLPTIGVWLMPDNVEPGSIESFVQHMLPDDDILWPRAVAIVGELPSHPRRFPETVSGRRKAEVHTWLAWQEQPGRPMGQAISQRYLDAAVPLAETFVAWLRRLFIAPPSP